MSGTALLSVTIVDGHGGPPLANQAVILRNRRIEAIVPMAQYRRADDMTDFFCENLRRYQTESPLKNEVDKRLGYPRWTP